MNLRKQLFAAVAMCLIAAVAFSSATYAWFALNRTAAVTGLSLTVQSDKPFLQIKLSGESEWKTSTAFPASLDAKLQLTHPSTIGSTMAWVTGESQVMDESTPAGKYTETDLTSLTAISTDAATGCTIEGKDTDGYYIKQVINFKVASASDATNLTLDADNTTITAGTNTLAPALRVLLVTDDGSYQLIDSTKAMQTGSASQLYATLTQGNVYNVTAYIYFDGRDSSANTANATDLSNVTVNLGFKVD